MEYVKRFDSVCEYSKYLRTAKTSKHFEEDIVLSSMDEANKAFAFTTTASLEEADNLLVYGDKTNLSKLQSSLHKLHSHKGECTRQILKSSVQGFLPNIQNYNCGLPDNMFTIVNKKYIGGTKIVNVVLNMGIDAGWSSDDIVSTGAKMLDAIVSLESQGYRCNLYTLDVSKSGSEIIAVAVRIKRSDDRMNLIKTAYALVNPSFERRHFFRFVETAPVKNRFYDYGSVVKEFSDIQKILKNLHIKVDYYLDMYSVRREGVKFSERVKL